MATAQFNLVFSAGGLRFEGGATRSADGGGSAEPALPVGLAGTLTTRTDENEGVITMASVSHGLTQGDVVDLYWGDGSLRPRLSAVVGTVTGASVAIDATGTAGPDLPAQDTALVVAPQLEFAAAIDGDALAILGAQMSYAAAGEGAASLVRLVDAGDAAIATLAFTGATPQIFDIAGGAANLFTGNPIVKGIASQGSATQGATLKLGWVQSIT